MDVAIIPKKLAQKGDFRIISKREYEEFLVWKKAVRVKFDEQWFWTREWQKKEAEADEAINKGKVSGSFSDHKKLVAALKRKRKP